MQLCAAELLSVKCKAYISVFIVLFLSHSETNICLWILLSLKQSKVKKH